MDAMAFLAALTFSCQSCKSCNPVKKSLQKPVSSFQPIQNSEFNIQNFHAPIPNPEKSNHE